MRADTQFGFLLCLGLILAAAGCGHQKGSPAPDADRLKGTWNLVYQQINGTKLPDEKMAEMFHGKMVFTDDRIRYTVELQGFDFELSYTLHPDQRPKAIDLDLLRTPDNKGIGQRTFGIYQLGGDMLRICHSKFKRPTDFNAEEGSHNQLIVLQRTSSQER